MRIDKITNGWNSKEYMDEYEKEILKEETFKEAETNRVADETIIVITKEGWGYKVTESEVKYIGKQEETDIPKLEESNIKFEYDPSPLNNSWTNESVKVTILSEIEDYQIQYSTNGKNWINYTTTIPVYENGPVYARLVNEFYEEVCHATGSVTNIDKESPSGTVEATRLEYSSIAISVDAYDETSGIAGYRYCIEGVQDFTELETSSEYTFTGLKASTSYTIIVKVIDNAGNSEDIEYKVKTKDPMAVIKDGELVAGGIKPAGKGDFSFSPVPEGGFYNLRIYTKFTECRSGGFNLECPDGKYTLYMDILSKRVASKVYDVRYGVVDGSDPSSDYSEPTYVSHVSFTGSIVVPDGDYGRRVSYRIPVVVKERYC